MLGSIFGAYLGGLVKQAGRGPSSAIGSVFESMPGSVLGSILRAQFGA